MASVLAFQAGTDATSSMIPAIPMGIESENRDIAAPEENAPKTEKKAPTPLPRVSKRREVVVSSRRSQPNPLQRELDRARAEGRWEDADKIAKRIESRLHLVKAG